MKSRNIQPGHYRTYKESGKTIEVNGGPKSKSSPVTPLALGIGLLVGGWFLVQVFTSPVFQSTHISPEQKAINEKSFEKMRIEEHGAEWNEEYKEWKRQRDKNNQ
jgi:hypothetical protein